MVVAQHLDAARDPRQHSPSHQGEQQVPLVTDSHEPGYGFDGIPIALISNGNPFITMVGSLLFGGLRAGSQNMQMMAGVKKEIVTVIQGLLIVFIAMQYLFKTGVRKAVFSRKGGKE